MQELLQIEVQKDSFIIHLDNSNSPSTFKEGFYLMCPSKEKILIAFGTILGTY